MNQDFEIKNGELIKYHGRDENVIIPDSVTSIGDHAFYECSSLTSVKIGDSVKTIGAYAFYGCKNLISLKLPEIVEDIGYKAFYIRGDES